MLDQKPLNKLLFIDIETTSQKASFFDLTERQQILFKKRFKKDFDSAMELKRSTIFMQKSTKVDSAEVSTTEEVVNSTAKKKAGKSKVALNSSFEDELAAAEIKTCEELKYILKTNRYSIKL